MRRFPPSPISTGKRIIMDYAQELIRMEEDAEYDRAQERLFHAHFEASELERASLKARWAVDSAMRLISGGSFDAKSEKIWWYTRIDHYPIWFCNDITHIVETVLRWGNVDSISKNSSGLARSAVRELQKSETVKMISGGKNGDLPHRISKFEKKGGVFGSVWGIMPNESCFQWFILAGNHVLNVANDASDRHSYPVEVGPRNPHEYRSIRDYFDYMRIAEKYWGQSIFRNTVLPSIAPVFPIVAIDAKWSIHFSRPESLSKRSMKSGFRLAKRVTESHELKDPPKKFISFFESLEIPVFDNIPDSFESWERAISPSSDRASDENFAFQFKRAMYLAQKAEFDWQAKYGNAFGGKAWGIVEK